MSVSVSHMYVCNFFTIIRANKYHESFSYFFLFLNTHSSVAGTKKKKNINELTACCDNVLHTFFFEILFFFHYFQSHSLLGHFNTPQALYILEFCCLSWIFNHHWVVAIVHHHLLCYYSLFYFLHFVIFDFLLLLVFIRCCVVVV